MLVYDVTSRDSFKNIQRWLDETKSQGSANIQLMLIGNKTDLVEEYSPSIPLKSHPSRANPTIHSIGTCGLAFAVMDWKERFGI